MLNLSSSWRAGVPLRVFLLSQVAASALLSMGGKASAQQNDPSSFQTLTIQNGVVSNPGAVAAGVGEVYSVPLSAILPTQMNVGDSEVSAHVASDNLDTGSEYLSEVQSEIEPVVIGPGGSIYVTDGHHTFAAFAASNLVASNPNVDVNVIANYSSDTALQFVQAMEKGTLYPVDNGVPQSLNISAGTSGISPPLPTSLSGLTNDPYRGLAYNVLKNPTSGAMTIPTSSGTVTVNYTGTGYAKTADEFSDFIWANAFRNANGGIGLPDVSPADANNAAAYAQNGSNVTTITGVTNTTSTGSTTSVQINQLPGYILPNSITLNQQISGSGITLSGANAVNSTNAPTNFSVNKNNSAGTNNTNAALNEANTQANAANAVLNGNNAVFNGINGLYLNEGLNPDSTPNVLTIEAAQSGFVMQLGNNGGSQVTLANTSNSFSGGVYIAAGTLATAFNGSADALGAAATGGTIDLSSGNANVMSSVQKENGIVFNSLSEGSATLTFGTNIPYSGTNSSGSKEVVSYIGSTGSFTENRNIAVGQESATINTNGNTITLTGQIATSNLAPAGYADLQVSDPGGGKLILDSSATAGNSGFYGNFDITKGATLEVMNSQSFGNTLSGSAGGTTSGIEIDDGTFQAGTTLLSTGTNFLLHGSTSTIDTNGYGSSFGSFSDTQRSLVVANSLGGGNNGSVSFTSTNIGSQATAQISFATSTGTTSINLGALSQNGGNGTLILQPAGTSISFGSSSQNQVLATSVPVTNGIVDPWVVIDSTNTVGNNPYSFAAYNSGTGEISAAPISVGSLTGASSAGTSVVTQTKSVSLGTNTQVYALNLENKKTITLATGTTLTIGDGTMGGLIMNGGVGGTNSITGGTLSLDGTGYIWAKGSTSNTNSIGSVIAGGNLVLAGSGELALNAANTYTGTTTIETGTLDLNVTNAIANSSSVYLSDDSGFNTATLNVNANQAISQINTAGQNSTINLATGTTLSVGAGTISSTISGVGAQLVETGTGLLDLSGASGGSIALGPANGSTPGIQVNSGQLRVASGIFASNTMGINVGGGAEVQFAQGGGGSSSNPISGAGDVRLVGGNLQLAGTNTYTGGTYIEYGGTLQTSTGSMPTGGNVYSSGVLVFDQDNAGTFGGVIHDGTCAGNGSVISCGGGIMSMIGTVGPGSVVIDDSVGSNGNITFSKAQTYTGSTTVESGTLTLGTGNTISSSTSLVLGQLGGSTTGTTSSGLVLEANNAVNNLTSVQGSTTNVALNTNTLTVNGSANINGTLSITGGTSSTTSGTMTFSNGATLANGGALKTDPATMNFIGNLTIGSSSYLSAAPGDVYNVTGNFLNSSTSSLWNTSGATLQFSGGSSSTGTVDHVFDLTSPIATGNVDAEDQPFAWGALELGTTGAPDPFDELTLQSGIPGDTDLALYVGELLGLVFSGNEVTNLIDPGDFNVYYDPAANPEFDGKTFQIAGGGELIASVPEPGSLSMMLSGMAGLAWFRRRRKNKAAKTG